MALRPGGGGVATYIRELLGALTPALPEHILRATVQSDAAADLPDPITPIVRPTSSGVRRALWGAAPVGGADLFHSLDVDLPVAARGATVSTFHDLSVFDTPWAHSRVRAAGERRLLRHALRTADVVVAVSDFTAERIHALTGRDSVVTELAPARWAVPPHPTVVERARARLGLPERFVLQVGTVEPRKDVHLVAAACRRLGIPLVLAGAGSTGPDVPSGTHGLGYVATADLPALYSAATVVTYASKYEGFGLPPLEAMACGGAVVASAVGALPQVLDDGAVLVARHDADLWVSALRGLVADQSARDELRERAVTAAGRWTWKRTAEQTLGAYRRAGIAV